MDGNLAELQLHEAGHGRKLHVLIVPKIEYVNRERQYPVGGDGGLTDRHTRTRAEHDTGGNRPGGPACK